MLDKKLLSTEEQLNDLFLSKYFLILAFNIFPPQREKKQFYPLSFEKSTVRHQCFLLKDYYPKLKT